MQAVKAIVDPWDLQSMFQPFEDEGMPPDLEILSSLVEEGDMPDSIDERLLRLEERFQAYVDLIKEQRSADRNQLVAVTTKADQFATGSDLQRLEVKVEGMDRALTDLRANQMPRKEIESKFDVIKSDMDGIKTSVGAVASVLDRLSTKLDTQAADLDRQHAEQDERMNRGLARRHLIVAVVAVSVAIIGLLISVIFELSTIHVKYVPVNNSPSVTTTTLQRGP